MARVTATEVKQIIDTDLADDVVDAFISGATEFIDEIFSSDTTLSSALKKEIERWVTAHMIASTREQQLTEAKAGSASAKFQGKTGMRMESTFYGQTALFLDTTGLLASSGGRSAKITAVTSFD